MGHHGVRGTAVLVPLGEEWNMISRVAYLRSLIRSVLPPSGNTVNVWLVSGHLRAGWMTLCLTVWSFSFDLEFSLQMWSTAQKSVLIPNLNGPNFFLHSDVKIKMLVEVFIILVELYSRWDQNDQSTCWNTAKFLILDWAKLEEFF